MVTDRRWLEDVMLLTTPYLEFIITVLIITGFAKISAKFINFETEAILPTDSEYGERDRSCR